MESQAIKFVERSADVSGFDDKLSTILKDFFQEKRIPIDGQPLLVHELRRSFVYSAARFSAYLSSDPANAKDRFGAFLYFDKHPQGNAGFDDKLSTILKDFFQEKRIPIDGQQLLVHELRRSFVYSAARFSAYRPSDPANAKARFGAFWVYFDKHLQGNVDLDRIARDELVRYFRHVQTDRSIDTATDAMRILQYGRPSDQRRFDVNSDSMANQKAKEALAKVLKHVTRLHDILYHPELQDFDAME